MGGAKKPTMASRDKSSGGRDAKKSKKGSESATPKRAEIVVKVNDVHALKIVRSAKVITVQELARQLGVKISAANKFLRDAVSNGDARRVGGYAGHYLYQSVAATDGSAKRGSGASISEGRDGVKSKAVKPGTGPAPGPDSEDSTTAGHS